MNHPYALTDRLTVIDGGVCAAKGFLASGVHCGIRRNKEKKDLALIVSEVMCDAAAVTTRNKVYASPVELTRQNVQNGKARAIVANSGNANACNRDGMDKARAMAKLTADALRIAPEDVLVASTGVIGLILPLEPLEEGIPAAAKALSRQGGSDAAEAIMTTDLRKKEIALSFLIDGKQCHIGGICKGSGMIHPNMGTMLAFVTTDVSIDAPMLQQALHFTTDRSFNMVSVDGDSSTNDTLAVLASGLAGNARITGPGSDYDAFCEALLCVCTYLGREIARDGEGATKLLTCEVSGAPDEQVARTIAKAVCGSSLFKAAIYGADANWGRALCAVGYADADFSIERVTLRFSSAAGELTVYEQGGGVPVDEEFATKVLSEPEVTVWVDLHDGTASATAWGCDLTYDYVKINVGYRS